MILSDLFNFSFLLILLIFICVKMKLSRNIFILLLGHLVLVFFLNYFLFDPFLFGDQFQYLSAVIHIRSGLFNFLQVSGSLKMHISALLMSLPPVPFLDSIYALSMANVFVFIVTFLILLKNNVLKGFNKMFYLLYPSLALYSALALRDMIITCFMLLSVYFISKRRYFFSIIAALPLILIKIQNILIYVLSFFVFFVFFKTKGVFVKVVAITSFVIFFMIFKDSFSIEAINLARTGMFYENMKTVQGAASIGSELVIINNYVDLFKLGFESMFSFIFKPLIWQARNPLQLVQSFENIFVGWVIFRLVYLKVKHKINSDLIRFLLVYTIIAFGLYGMVVFNYGTAVRYKFPFVIVFVTFFYYELVRIKPSLRGKPIFFFWRDKK